MAAMTVAWPHDLFNAYVQHRVAITVGSRHLDVTVDLTFFEDSSEHEREHMDTNGDGRVSRAEIDAHVQRSESAWSKAVALRLEDQVIALTPLREPEMDLLGNDRVGRGHHRLTLHFFAPTPAELKTGAELIFENRLWPAARALAALHVHGRDGFRVEALGPTDPVHPPVRGEATREFRARIVSAPALRSGSASIGLAPSLPKEPKPSESP